MRILIAEDEDKIRATLKKNLEAECYAVDAAQDGAEGLALARLNDYDLIILDNVMPKMNGLEVCETLRMEGVAAPILLLSVQSETDIKVRALNAGADDYLTKPFSLEELTARMRALLRRPKQMEEDILTCGDIVLDTRRHLCTCEGEEVQLTLKEFMLLQYFMRNEGIVLSRGMIMEHVWDMNADPFSNTIESHVLSLRKKIGAEKTHYIATVSGRGYRFQVPHSAV